VDYVTTYLWISIDRSGYTIVLCGSSSAEKNPVQTIIQVVSGISCAGSHATLKAGWGEVNPRAGGVGEW